MDVLMRRLCLTVILRRAWQTARRETRSFLAPSRASGLMGPTPGAPWIHPRASVSERAGAAETQMTVWGAERRRCERVQLSQSFTLNGLRPR